MVALVKGNTMRPTYNHTNLFFVETTSRDHCNYYDMASDGEQDDIVIAVMGSTGTGKSSFVRLLSGDNSIKVEGGSESVTIDTQAVSFQDPESRRNVTIVDTPGFDHSHLTDTDVLKKITDFLVKTYDNGRKFNGLVYFQRISDSRMGGRALLNLRTFRKLCGPKAYKNVVVLTTFWDQQRGVGEDHEKQMKTKPRLFKDFVDGDACFMRHDRTFGSASAVLRHIIRLHPTNVRIQTEICVEGKPLEATAAGSVHRADLERIIAKHKEEMAKVEGKLEKSRQDNGALRKELEEKRDKLQQDLKRWEDEKVELKKGLDETQEARKRAEMDLDKERTDNEKWRQNKESEWNSQFDDQSKKHDEAMQAMKTQLEDEKTKHESAKQEDEKLRREEEAKWEAERKAQEKKHRELLEEHDRKWQSRLDDQSKKHVDSMQALKARFDRKKKAREEEYRKERREEEAKRDTERQELGKENRESLEEHDGRWKSWLDDQSKKHADFMHALQTQFDQEKTTLEDEYRRGQREGEYEREAERHHLEMQQLLSLLVLRQNESKEREQRRYDEGVEAGHQQALEEINNKSFAQRGWEFADELAIMPRFIGKPGLAVAGAVVDVTTKIWGRKYLVRK